MASFTGTERQIGTLLKSARKLSVPPYQREYSWTSDEIEDLWSDLVGSMNSDSEHFLGIIVLVKGQVHGEYGIIDGQQRITSVLLLLAAIRETARLLGVPDAIGYSYIQNNYFGDYGFMTSDPTPKFTTNITDQTIFEDYVFRSRKKEEVESAAASKLRIASHKLLLSAFHKLWQLVEDMVRAAPSKEAAARTLQGLATHLETRVKVMEMVVEDEAMAFTVFETINGRGLELSAMDLVKNKLFGSSGGSIELVKRTWDMVMHDLNGLDGRSGDQAKGKFLRHHWISYHGPVHTKDLYRQMKGFITDPKTAVDFVQRLGVSSSHYSAIHNPQHQLWGEFKTEQAARTAFELSELGSLQSYPIILAALRRMQDGHSIPEQVTEIIRLMLVMTIRYSLVCQKRTGVIDHVYPELAYRIAGGELESAYDVFDGLRHLYPSDDEFREAFQDRDFVDHNKARYVLAVVAAHLQNGEQDPTSDTSSMTLEHIIPRVPSKAWRDYARQRGYEGEMGEWTHKIGNLALIRRKPNQRFSNSALFPRKRDEYYRASSIPITNMLGASDEWTPKEVQQRSKYLADQAVLVWRFGD